MWSVAGELAGVRRGSVIRDNDLTCSAPDQDFRAGDLFSESEEVHSAELKAIFYLASQVIGGLRRGAFNGGRTTTQSTTR